MKQRILSLALALCLCIFSQSIAYAWQEDPLLQEDVLTKESTTEPVTRDSTIPTPTEVYEAMIALKTQDAYKEGTTWTNDKPYSSSTGYYHWKGGPLDGKNIVAAGCVAFAFVLSDTAFGRLPARMYAPGEFSYEDIKSGDILRVNTDNHTVIVLETSDTGVVIAEGNYSGKVHWERTMSKADVMFNTSHYITRYPEGYIPPDDPTANDIIGTGTLDGGLTWNLTKAGTMTVSGNGDMPDFSSTEDQPWNSYSSQIRKVVIENGVTRIGSCAFWQCGILSAEIPSSVTTIGNSAFRGSSIISVIIPSSVKSVCDSAFRECQNLSSVTVSEGLETISQNAFRSCTSLTHIALPASIGEVGTGAFFQCTEMISATFDAGNKKVKLGDNMFTQCYCLMHVTLPKNIDCIGEGMFQNCQKLPGVEIPQGAASIGGSAFASSGVSVVIIPDSVKTIGIAAFSACPLTDLYFTGTEAQWKSISKIGDTSVAVSKATIHYNHTPATDPDPDDGDNDNNSESIGNSENNNDNNSETSDNSEKDNNSESNGNDNNSETNDNSENGDNSSDSSESGNHSGNGDDSETRDNSETGSNSETGNHSGNSESQAPEQTPIAKGETFTINKATYKVTKVGEEVELTTSNSMAAKVTINTVTGTDGVTYKVTSIGSKSMQNNKKLTRLTIGNNVNTIGSNSFSGCTKLTTVTIGKTSKSKLTTIGKSAFSGCRKLGKVTIKSTKLGSVGKQTFKGTKSGLKVKVPSKQLTKYKRLFKKAGLKSKQVV